MSDTFDIALRYFCEKIGIIQNPIKKVQIFDRIPVEDRYRNVYLS